ncbi:unnamed protein product [Polarella glacialis]|uniref:Uncharacterized protein n=1 Tax=Polarella glacialis TaxID=89957 RepID=A0A813H1X6_POLGL|nr:unnamed protein product [Polarella glacialis]
MLTRCLTLIHYECDHLCIWKPSGFEKNLLARCGIHLLYILQDNIRAAELLGRSKHAYRELLNLAKIVSLEDGDRPSPFDIPLTTLTMMQPVNLRTDIGLASMGFIVIGWFVVGLLPEDRLILFSELGGVAETYSQY